MHVTIRDCDHVDGKESDHTHAQYAAPAHNSCLTDTNDVCAGRRNDVFGVLRRLQFLPPHLFSSDGVASRGVALRTSNITQHTFVDCMTEYFVTACDGVAQSAL
jgi:hypothetical protein